MNNCRKIPCCVSVCRGERFDLAHHFPREPERLELWLKALDCPELYSTPKQKLGFVCSRHFRIADYKHPQSRSINKTAIPSLNIKDLSQLHLCKNSVVSPEQDASTPDLPEKQTFFKQEYIEETNLICASDPVPSDESPEIKIAKVESLQDVHNEIRDERLSNQVFIKDENHHQGETECLTFFKVTHPNYPNPITLNSFWLRCHCKCFLCYDAMRQRKKVSPLDLSEKVLPRSVKQVGLDTLAIEWDDNHKSEYNLDFLFNLEISKSRIKPCKIWNGGTPAVNGYIPTEFACLVSFYKECEEVFRGLCEIGVAIISNISDHSISMAKLAICRLFPHLDADVVKFNEFNDIQVDISSNITYDSVDCGLRCYFVKQETEFILVDGLCVASNLSNFHANAFKTLSEVLVPLELTDCHVKCEIAAPVIEIDADKQEVIRVCMDVYKIGILNKLPPEMIKSLYESLRLMMGCVAERGNHWVIKLRAGTMILLDNYRILHKCLHVTNIWEAHIHRKDYISRMQYLGFL